MKIRRRRRRRRRRRYFIYTDVWVTREAWAYLAGPLRRQPSQIKYAVLPPFWPKMSCYQIHLPEELYNSLKDDMNFAMPYVLLNAFMWASITADHDDVIKWKQFSRYWLLCGEFTDHRWIPRTQRPVTRSFDVFFDLPPNIRLSKQSWGWWFETPSRPLWRHCNDVGIGHEYVNHSSYVVCSNLICNNRKQVTHFSSKNFLELPLIPRFLGRWMLSLAGLAPSH